MTEGPLADVVAAQYERWVYPEPIVDLESWLVNNWQWFDPSHSFRVLWPDREIRDDLDILVAGCGTNQAAVLAYTNPKSHVVAVDVSQSSLDHHQMLKEKYSLDNLELQILPIEELHTLHQQFDLIISTGVLHHLADPFTGMQALAQCLRAEGVIAVMLYAKYGRVGVEMLQSVFRDMELKQDRESLRIVRDALAYLPTEHPVVGYISVAPDLDIDAGMIDTFLHGRDRSYTVDECLELVKFSGLAFQDWFLNASYYPSVDSRDFFNGAVRQLPKAEQWSIMERMNSRNACHFFLARHASEVTASIDFASTEALSYIPSFRHRCGLTGNEAFRYDWSMSLDPFDLGIMRQIDGRRTIRQAVHEAAQHGLLVRGTMTELEARALRIVQSLWQLDFLAIQIAAKS